MEIAAYKSQIEHIIDLAIKEDITDPFGNIPTGDHSALACLSKEKKGKAKLLIKGNGILAGVELSKWIIEKIDSTIEMKQYLQDGDAVKVGDIGFELYGNDIKILQAERLILNFMQRMSGIASHTAQFVALTKDTKAKILDTRKTTPALRILEKWAVKIGGGHNHRMGLYDYIMLKDNHIDFCGGIVEALTAVKKYQEENKLNLGVEVETRNLDDVKKVLEYGYAQRIMFDNFSVENVYSAVKLVKGQMETEVSGGITLDTVKSYAEAEPDFISVGALTHSSRSMDISLKAF